MSDLSTKKKAFLAAVVELARKHDMALGHEDSQGAFKVYDGFDESSAELLMAALDGDKTYD